MVLLRFRSGLSLGRVALRYARHRSTSYALARQIRCLSTNPNEKWIMKSEYTVDIPVKSLPQFIFDAQEEYAGRTAFINGVTHESVTHGEFRDLCHRFGSALTRLDISKGDVVAIISPNCPEFAISFFGVASIGAVNTTINCTYTPEEIAQQLTLSGASSIITHSALYPTVKKACQLCGGIRHIIVNGSCNDEAAISFQSLCKDDGKAFPHNVKVDPLEDIIVLPYSSGTTGLPKGVMLTHHNLVANLQQITHPIFNSMKVDDASFQEVFLGFLPFFHIYGMTVCMGINLMKGSKMVTLPIFEPKLFVDTLRKYQITYMHTVPPIINFLVHSSLVTPDLLKSAHTVVCGAAPLGPAIMQEFHKKFGNDFNFQEGYGMTEASPVTHLTPVDSYIPGSTGLVVPNTMAKIVDLNTGELLGPGIEGELCIHGPQVMKGYFNNEKETRETLDEDGWLHTGDIAKMDENYKVYIVDRLKELIKVKGLQVAPAELEDLLRKHPDVTDVAVIGIPDDRAGEVPRAYVVSKPGSDITADEVKDYVAKEVAPHKRLLGGVHFTDIIPKSSTGKILRRELRAQI